MTNLIAMSALRSPLVDPINRHPGAASCPFPVELPILSPVKLAASYATTALTDRACNLVAMQPSVVDLLAPPSRPPTVFKVWVSRSCDTLVHNFTTAQLRFPTVLPPVVFPLLNHSSPTKKPMALGVRLRITARWKQTINQTQRTMGKTII
jgi:hypothetical protein